MNKWWVWQLSTNLVGLVNTWWVWPVNELYGCDQLAFGGCGQLVLGGHGQKSELDAI